MLIDFEPGDYVKNPSNKDWGIGQVQSIIGNKVTVNFENYGKKVINIDNVTLEKVDNENWWIKNPKQKFDWYFQLCWESFYWSFKKGLKIEIKEDKSPVSNGDLEVNELISNKIEKLTPNIPIISEETVNLKMKIKLKYFG